MLTPHRSVQSQDPKAERRPLLYVYKLPPHLNVETVQRHPSQSLDF